MIGLYAAGIIIGIIVGFVGIKLSESYHYITQIVAPVILLLLGVIYFLMDLRSSHHHHHPEVNDHSLKNKKSKSAIITSLSIAMFLTPCFEIEAYYFQAATVGWIGIFIVSMVYFLVTLLIMFTLVYLGIKGVSKFKSHFLEHHEKRITGIVLILLGVLAYFVEF